MTKEDILFIINPISGGKRKNHIPHLIKRWLNQEKFNPSIRFSEYAGHAFLLAKAAKDDGFKYIVAVGGDGTVNETAKALLHSDVAMGIIPMGSGNGLARHLKIPLQPARSICFLNQTNIYKMDAGMMNELPFFCTAGVGFDAQVGKAFADNTGRGLQTYVRMVLKEYFHYKPQHLSLLLNGQKFNHQAFMLTISNASQFGNNAVIAPLAQINDGCLDISILSKLPIHAVAPTVLRLFTKSMHKSHYIKTQKVKEIAIERESDGPAHIDGEPVFLGRQILIKVVPAALNIMAIPKERN